MRTIYKEKWGVIVLKGSRAFYFCGICVGIALLIIHVLGYRYFLIPDETIRFIFFGYAVVFTFILYESKNRIVDIVFLILGSYSALYLLIEGVAAKSRMGIPNTLDTISGLIAIIVIIEATRRAYGKALPIISGLLFLYAFWLGQYLPRFISIPTFDIGSIVNICYIGLNGIFGIPLKVMIIYIFLFILFGTMLDMVGGADFYIELSRCIVKKGRGMSSKIAIISSTLIGSLTGSAVANVTITGAVTIPAMKKEGFKPEIAGAIEACASSGGQLMPPVMAAVAFVMAEFLRVPYVVVLKYAIVPILLYYLALWITVVIYIDKHPEISDIEEKDGRSLTALIKAKGFHLTPLIVLIVLLILRYSPLVAVWWAIGATFIGGLLSSETRKLINIPNILITMKKVAEVSAPLVIASATAGFILGIVGLTGLGTRISGIIQTASLGKLYLGLFGTALISLFFGMGLPTTVCYILIVTLIAPALMNLGMIEPAAHFFVLYYAIMSMITPPMCFASFAASSIAKADPMKTGWASIKFGASALIIPFLFAYNPGLLLIGSLGEVIWAIFKGILAILIVTAIANGELYSRYLFRKIPFIVIGKGERIILCAILGLLILNPYFYNIVGILIFIALCLWYLFSNKNRIRRDAIQL